jgi:hypothetical protein
VDGVVAPLHDALDGLAAVDDAALSDVELGEALVALSRVEGRLAAQRARLTARFDARRVWAADGYRSAAGWMAHRCSMAPARARAEVRMARVVRHLPATAAALASGSIGIDAARSITRVYRPATAEALGRDEVVLVAQARALAIVDFERVVRYWEQLADADGVERDAAERDGQRRVYCSGGLDGMWLDGWLPTTRGAVVRNELERLEHQLFLDDCKTAAAEHGDDGRVDQLARTPAQRRADALVEMALRSATAPVGGRRPRPLVTVLVGYETFAGRVCQLATGETVTPGQVAALLDEAVIERVVFDGPSRVTDVGEARLFTGALRRAIEVRDRTCIDAGCHQPAARCDVDHVTPAADGGPTVQHNGVLRCPFHHRRRHRTPRPPPS